MNWSKVTPMRDRIIVRQEDKETTDWGFILKASKGIVSSQEQTGRYGTVVEIGPDVDETQLKLGDRIMYGEFEYPQVDINGLNHYVLQDKDVVGVIE